MIQRPPYDDSFGQPAAWIAWVLGIVVAVILAIRIAEPIVAYDIWWHMALGRNILESGVLITDHSLFTWTPALEYQVYNSWLAQIILYLWYEATGTVGLLFLRYLVYFGFFLLALQYALKRQVASNPLAWLIILLGIMFVWTSYNVKPELFTIGFMALSVWLYFIIRSSRKDVFFLPYLFPLIIVVWANTHGAFFIVSLFFLATAVGELLNVKLSPSQSMPVRLRLHYFFALALCIPAVFINPFGYELPLTIISSVLGFGNEPDVRTIGFHPTFLFNSAPYYLLDYLILAMVIFVFLVWQKLKNRQTDWVVILAFLGYCMLYTKFARLTLFLAPVFVFVCLDLLSNKDKSWAWPSSALLRNGLSLFCVVSIAVIGWRVVDSQRCDISRGFAHLDKVDIQPVAETEFIKNHVPGKKIGNMYNDGGYMVYQLWPEKQVMIDTRNFPFTEWKEAYFEFHSGNNIGEYVRNANADLWLINYKNISHYIWFVESPEWQLRYLGPIAAVFTPSGEQPVQAVISDSLEDMIAHDKISEALNAALQLDDLTFASSIRSAAIANLKGECTIDHEFTHEVTNVVDGYQAFREQRYIDALNHLSEGKQFIRPEIKAIQTLEILARGAWDVGDYAQARGWSVKVLEYPANIVDAYNFMVADWHYSHGDVMSASRVDDGFSWEAYSEYILENQKQLAEQYQFIVYTAKAMKDGNYDGNARLRSRFESFEN